MKYSKKLYYYSKNFALINDGIMINGLGHAACSHLSLGYATPSAWKTYSININRIRYLFLLKWLVIIETGIIEVFLDV